MHFTTRTRRRIPAEISLTPLIDLFLNILVFFLVTTTFATHSLFFVDLPEAKTGEKGAQQRKEVSITVSPRGEIAVDDRVVTLDGLKQFLTGIPQERRAVMPVLLRADRQTLHGVVVSVLDAVRDAGLKNVGILTKTPGEK